MSDFDLILRNACVNGAFVSDIGVKNGIITSLGFDLIASTDTKVIECDGAVVTPGGVDGHVHLAQDQSIDALAGGYVCADSSKSSL